MSRCGSDYMYWTVKGHNKLSVYLHLQFKMNKLKLSLSLSLSLSLFHSHSYSHTFTSCRRMGYVPNQGATKLHTKVAVTTALSTVMEHAKESKSRN